jgi:hypothetical protein
MPDKTVSADRVMAYCGNECGRCPRYLATRTGDRGRLQKVASLWRRMGWRDREPLPEEMACYGCASTVWCRYGVKPCAEAKHAGHCGECTDYPCGLIQAALERTEEYIKECRRLCSAEEFAALEMAFFRKSGNLTALTRKTPSGVSMDDSDSEKTNTSGY